MPYVTFTEHPDVLGRQYRDSVSSGGVTIAEVDEVLYQEVESTQEEHQKLKDQAEQEYQTAQEAEANRLQEPEVRAKPRPTLEDILAVLPVEVTAALDARLTEQSLGVTQSDNVS